MASLQYPVDRRSAAWPLLMREVLVRRWRERQGQGQVEEEAELESTEVVGEDGTGEGRRVRGPTQPYTPTEKERREHNLTHYPHRTWCECCMVGRAIAGAHARSRDEADPHAGEFHFDYCFLKNEVKDEPAVTLVGVDKASDAILAHVVPEKGTRFDWVAAQLDRDVRRFGYHGRIVVKSDGENAARDLMNELARKRKELPTVVETSKPYDSKSNGRAEGAIRRLESQVRTLKIATERNLGIVIDVHTPLFDWLVEHSADVLTKCAVGTDGRTPYERLKSKMYHGEMIEFASMVMVKLQGKLQGGILKERWIPGLWLVKRWSTDEHVVSAASGRVVRARDVRLFSADKAFDVNFAKNVVGTPSNPSAVENEETVLHDIPRAPVARPEDPVSAPVTRQVILLKAYFERFGYSADCSKCRALMRGEIVGPSHTVA